MSYEREQIFVGKNNGICIQLTENGLPADLSLVTRMILQLGDFVIDSDVVPAGTLDWLSLGNGRLLIKAGKLAGIEDHVGIHRAILTIHDPDTPDGFIWLDGLKSSLVIEIVDLANSC